MTNTSHVTTMLVCTKSMCLCMHFIGEDLFWEKI